MTQSGSLTGMVEGTVTVVEKLNLQVHGLVVGTLILKAGSEVVVHGMVRGSIVNEGGCLRVYGIVEGPIEERAGTTEIHSKARVSCGIDGEKGKQS